MNKFKPKAPLRTPGRIRGLRSSTPASFRSPSPAMLRSPSPSPVAAAAEPPARKGPSPCEQCGHTSFTEDGGQVICENCGAISLDTGNFSNDVVFGETDSGRTQQVGTRVNEGQTHQRTFMPRNQALGRVGHEAMQTSEKAKLEAESTFNKFAVLLGIRQQERNAAAMIFHMAYANGFVRGRTIESVAIVSLYLATRRAKDASPPYSLMLIDFAEPANTNVFDLGRMMQDMVKRLYLGSDGKLTEKESLLLRAPGAEVLIEKFVKHLDFGPDEYKIRKDATKILQRMKKDWLHDGRRPSGVCGAAVILAARMNNYRRTLREVVLCAKVTEFTVSKRLEEFKFTDSSKLSVNDFRDDHVRDALRETDPPAFYQALQPPAKKKRGRPRKNKAPETAAQVEGDNTPASNTPANEQDSAEQPLPKRARVDADGFAVPALPDHSVQSSEPPVKRGPGKPKGSKNWKAPPPTPAEIAYEAEIEHEIQEALDSNRELEGTPKDISNGSVSADAPTAADMVAFQHDQSLPFDLPGPLIRTNEGNMGNVNMDPELGINEFDDDPEVSNCILSEAEKALKERIWVTENAEWLRQENAKKVKRELKIRHMIEAGIDPEEHQKRKGKMIKRKDGARRSGRVGDVEYLKDDFHKVKKSLDSTGQEVADDEEEAAAGPGAAQAHIAVRKMFNQRGTFSRRINYKNLLDAYQLPSESASLSPSRSPSHDREESVASVDSSAPRASSSNDWFTGTKKGQSRSKASVSQAKRFARATLERKRPQISHDAAKSRSPEDDQGATENEDNDTAEQEEEEEEHSTALQQLPTPRPTQPQSRTRAQTRLHSNKLPPEEPVLAADSSLPSTHTLGADQGIPTPSSTQHTGAVQRSTSAQHAPSSDSQIQVQTQPIDEDDVESDEGDYVDDEEEDEDNEGEDDEVDAAFAGNYQGSNDHYEWDDEVVEE